MARRGTSRHDEKSYFVAIREARALVRSGETFVRAAELVRLSPLTVKRYMNRDPSTAAEIQARRVQSRIGLVRTRKGGRDPSIPVHADVASTRDQLVAAFRAGDLDEHARLSRRLAELLDLHHPRRSRPECQIDVAEAAE